MSLEQRGSGSQWTASFGERAGYCSCTEKRGHTFSLELTDGGGDRKHEVKDSFRVMAQLS